MSTEQDVTDWIRKQISANDVVLFMKGSAAAPQCGFSGKVTQILKHMGVEFKDVDVLKDMAVRDGIKKFTNWPTIPQLYIKGEFVGGCDIISEMFQTGELEELLHEKGIGHRHVA